jgi:hypothetical protein
MAIVQKRNGKKKRNWKKRGNKKIYRPTIAKTIQLATQRPKSVVLKFRKFYQYVLRPAALAGPSTKTNCYIQIAGNSIYNILEKDGNNAKIGSTQQWNAVNTAYSPASSGVQTVDSYSDWKAKFDEYVVLGSRCQATFKPFTQAETSADLSEPTTCYILRASDAAIRGADNSEKNINDLLAYPYIQRRQIMPHARGSQAQAYIDSRVSSKKWFGVKNVTDNAALGAMFNTVPDEKVSYLIGVVPSTGAAQTKPAIKMLVSIKMEYLVLLREPTDDNTLTQGAPSQGIVAHAEL